MLTWNFFTDGWGSQHWRRPVLRKKQEPSEQTLLERHVLNKNERIILVTTQIDHARMMSILDVRPQYLREHGTSIGLYNLTFLLTISIIFLLSQGFILPE